MAVPAGALNLISSSRRRRSLSSKRSRGFRVAASLRPSVLVRGTLPSFPWKRRGPHCTLAGHTNGQVLRLGDTSEFDEEEDDE